MTSTAAGMPSKGKVPKKRNKVSDRMCVFYTGFGFQLLWFVIMSTFFGFGSFHNFVILVTLVLPLLAAFFVHSLWLFLGAAFMSAIYLFNFCVLSGCKFEWPQLQFADQLNITFAVFAFVVGLFFHAQRREDKKLRGSCRLVATV